MADAEAICEAVTWTNMRFVPIKTPEQQSGLVLHRTRHLLIRQQTAVINAIRAHLAEFGIVAEWRPMVSNAGSSRPPSSRPMVDRSLAALGTPPLQHCPEVRCDARAHSGQTIE